MNLRYTQSNFDFFHIEAVLHKWPLELVLDFSHGDCGIVEDVVGESSVLKSRLFYLERCMCATISSVFIVCSPTPASGGRGSSSWSSIRTICGVGGGAGENEYKCLLIIAGAACSLSVARNAKHSKNYGSAY